jgi:ATP-dependent RNA helicase DHX29
MAPKKKKTQLKPVARGFATTSVPKKVDPLPESAETVLEVTPSSHTTADEQNRQTTSQSTSKPDQSVADQAQDTERLASQALVDKYQEKTEKDISRYGNCLECLHSWWYSCYLT